MRSQGGQDALGIAKRILSALHTRKWYGNPEQTGRRLDGAPAFQSGLPA